MPTGRFLSASVIEGTTSPLTVPVSGIPGDALILAWLVEAHASGDPPAFDPVERFSQHSLADLAAGFAIDADSSVSFLHKWYDGETDFSVTFAGGTPTAVGLLVCAFDKTLHAHDFTVSAGGATAGTHTGLVDETYELALWYSAGDSPTDVLRADDAMDTVFGTDFGGAFDAFVLQERLLHSTAIPALSADGTSAGSQTRVSRSTWGKPSGASATDEWGWPE